MRKALIILAVLVALLIVGAAVFLATFDADRYRPLLVSQLEKQLGKPVRLDRVSLGWQGGIAIQLRGLTIADETAAQGEPLAQVDSISALVQLFPLLKKEIRVSSVILTHPQVHVVRRPDGQVNLEGLAAVAAPAAASGQAAPAGTPSAQPVSFNVALLRVENGILHWTDATAHPPAEVWVRALDVTVRNVSLHEPMDVEARAAVAADAPNVSLSGRLTLPSQGHPGALQQLKVSVTRLRLEQVLPPAGAGEAHLEGTLSAGIEGGLASLDPAQLAQTVSGTGTLKLTEAKIANLNILREVFAKFSMLPGLVESLQTRLPEEYQAKFAAKDTVLAPLNLAMRVESGVLQCDDLRLSTDTFALAGSGRVGFDRSLSIRATLHVEPTLTAAIVRSVSELQALTNASGEIEIPLTIQGTAPQVTVLPDLHYITSKVIATKAADLLGEFLKKSSPDESTAPEGSQNPQAAPADSGGSILGQLLQRALEKQAAKHAPVQQ